MHSLSSAVDGFGSSQVRFVVAESPAETGCPEASPTFPKASDESAVLVPIQGESQPLPSVQPAPGEPEQLPSPAPEKPPGVVAGRVPYRIVPICQLKADISGSKDARRADLHPDKRDYAAEAFADRQVIDARGTSGWRPLSYAPLGPAASVCHPPAYFAQPRLERYGHSLFLQPVWSGAHFYGTVMTLPAMWMVRRPWNHVCRDPLTDPAGFDATAEFFRPPVTQMDGPQDVAP